MLTLFVRGMLCNWMVSTGVVGAMISTSVTGKVIAMWMPIMVFFYMVFEHSIVNMFLFPSGLLLGAHFTCIDYLLLERDPDGAGQPGRRPAVHRPDAVRDAREDRRRSAFVQIAGASAAAALPGRRQRLKVSVGQHSDKGRKEVNQDFYGVCVPERSRCSRPRASPSRWPTASARAT